MTDTDRHPVLHRIRTILTYAELVAQGAMGMLVVITLCLPYYDL